ncbi:hypothetical protein L6R53_20325 [Myxococcota bacterium]|nr:hypothetical protein [Myxococcota bacterium]
MHPLPRLLAMGLLLPLLSGCQNPCQSLCQEIADFAKRECGLDFPEAELDQCIADHASANLADGEAKTCRDGKGQVDEEWDCQEIALYFEDGTGGGTGDGGGDTGTAADESPADIP